MTLVSRVLIGFSLLLALSAAGAALAVLGAYRASAELEHADLARRQHAAYLGLSNHAYQLFKQYADVVLLGEPDPARAPAGLPQAIERDFAEIRHHIAREIELVGESEIDELETLHRIEALLRQLMDEHREILALHRDGTPPGELVPRLARLDEQLLDGEFDRLIGEAIAGEAAELELTRVEAARRLALLEGAAVGFVLLGMLTSLLVVLGLVRQTRRPLRELLRAADAIASGRAAPRIDELGPQELSDLARAFNAMGAEILRRQGEMAEHSRALEQAVAQRTAELEQALAAQRDNASLRRQLLADVSHELRTPLTIIRGEADVALRGSPKTPAAYREALERSRTAAEHCTRIVNDLLFIARHELGAASIRVESVDLAELLPRVVEASVALHGGGARSIGVRGTEQPSLVAADPVRIRQVLLILLENAVNYGGEHIQVALEPVPTGWRVSVSDDGPGMSTEDRERAFERFYRGSSAASRYERGSGLGLSVARAIVEAHGGRIELSSEPGRGVCVAFTLPVRPALKAVS